MATFRKLKLKLSLSKTLQVACLLQCFVSSKQIDPMCEIASVHIENEDGSQQVFEVKRLQPLNEVCDACTTAGRNGLSSHFSSGVRVATLNSNVRLPFGEIVNACDITDNDLPHGICASKKDGGFCAKEPSARETLFEEYADEMVERDIVPLASGDNALDKRIALAIVTLNTGSVDEAIEQFSTILTTKSKAAGALYGRGVAYVRKGLQDLFHVKKALADLDKALKLSPGSHEVYARRAEVYASQGRYQEALDDMTEVVQLHPSEKAYFFRGILNLMLENLADAGEDMKKNLDQKGSLHVPSYYHLALALYYRGKIRNAIEVFKEVMKLNPDLLDACTGLGQAFRVLGNLKAARSRFNHTLLRDRKHVLTLQLQGTMDYHSGYLKSAVNHLTKCLDIDPSNQVCLYFRGLTHVSEGSFYHGVKDTTMVMVNQLPSQIRMSPEFLKAHYLREHARYLHGHLDQTIDSLRLDEEYNNQFKEHWIKLLPFIFKAPYKEQPGLRPEIQDVIPGRLQDYSKNMKALICHANKIGWSMQVNSDGFTPNRHLNLAMGLAAIHIAQLLEGHWKGSKHNKANNVSISWREFYHIAVQYRRLADPEVPVFWVDRLPEHHTKDGFKTDVTFISGDIQNIQVMQYFDLVFKLAKTMLEHYTGDAGLKADLSQAKTCEDLLIIARKRNVIPHGFLVSTQVPSSQDKSMTRLDGVTLTLTENINKRILFAISIASTKSRTLSYHTEIESLFSQLQDDIRKTGINKISDIDSLISVILSMAYYFYNLMPLTRGTSVVAYTVTLGLLMSIGREATGKIPTGKLLDLEAMLLRAPDAFISVTKQWMSIKKNSTPVGSLPKVWDSFPTVRSVLEVLAVSTESC